MRSAFSSALRHYESTQVRRLYKDILNKMSCLVPNFYLEGYGSHKQGFHGISHSRTLYPRLILRSNISAG